MISAIIAMAMLSGVSVHYGTVRALEGIDLVLAPGSITGLIGPNGAGKTTLMRALTGLQPIDAGVITINNIDVHESPRQALGLVSYVSDQFGVFHDLSVRQALHYRALCQHVPVTDIPERVVWAAELLGLGGLLARAGGQLSRGQRQRLAIAMAIMHQPKLLVLDEPASGLDPDARAHLSETFCLLARQGMSLLVSSHILAELVDYATDIAMMDRGRLVERSTLRQIVRPAGLYRVMLVTAPEQLPEVAGLRVVARPQPDMLIIEDMPDMAARADLLARMMAAGFAICECAPHQQSASGSLIDLYRRHIGAEPHAADRPAAPGATGQGEYHA